MIIERVYNMEGDNIQGLNFSQQFNIDEVSFNNVNRDFEKQFKERYKESLSMMSDSHDKLENASGASSLDALEKMARKINNYNINSNFEASFEEVFKENEPFTQT
ncbi:hypothetical protein [Pseudobacteroides cellulosolvens]|uniref:Uncharacterized protein n=1 Tax=Pseudobacteroides cellulosolvens ATCC 35603 = DSM 2933 TaxID=398512 RepID=A0A0L6JPJ9_9FIRM|nr:hypothetical protein [Pseudobacteroides cellulosolvens]KNY27302.1 hypothetical protein Bccel_2573 [Pseudobacteroides cellulosolvens ATCC 35603 = DSM 2933]